MKTKRIIFLSLLTACLSLPLASAWATFISPKRVMIEDRQRAATVTIANNDAGPMVYSFGWERRAQMPNGDSVLLEQGQTLPGYNPADPLLTFSPRQATLQPGEVQKVRIVVQRPAGLAEGEYHSHMLIKADPPTAPKDSKNPVQQPGTLAGAISVRAYTSIPVFVRHGKTTLNVKLVSASIVKVNGKDHLRFSLTNDSTRSAYIAPELICGAGPSTVQLTTYKVYAESKTLSRDSLVPDTFSVDSCAGNLQVRLVSIQDFEFRRKVIDQVAVTRQ